MNVYQAIRQFVIIAVGVCGSGSFAEAEAPDSVVQEVRVESTPASYKQAVNAPPLGPEGRRIRVLAGGRLKLSATVHGKWRKAQLIAGEQELGVFEITPVGGASDSCKLSITVDPISNVDRTTQSQFVISLTAADDSVRRLVIGVLQIIPDKKPDVALRTFTSSLPPSPDVPENDGAPANDQTNQARAEGSERETEPISSTGSAKVPLSINASDDLSLTQVWLEVNVIEHGEIKHSKTIPLEFEENANFTDLTKSLDLRAFQEESDLRLDEGSELWIQAFAADALQQKGDVDRTSGSEIRIFRIVSDEHFLENAMARHKVLFEEIATELQRLIDNPDQRATESLGRCEELTRLLSDEYAWLEGNNVATERLRDEFRNLIDCIRKVSPDDSAEEETGTHLQERAKAALATVKQFLAQLTPGGKERTDDSEEVRRRRVLDALKD